MNQGAKFGRANQTIKRETNPDHFFFLINSTTMKSAHFAFLAMLIIGTNARFLLSWNGDSRKDILDRIKENKSKRELQNMGGFEKELDEVSFLAELAEYIASYGLDQGGFISRESNDYTETDNSNFETETEMGDKIQESKRSAQWFETNSKTLQSWQELLREARRNRITPRILDTLCSFSAELERNFEGNGLSIEAYYCGDFVSEDLDYKVLTNDDLIELVENLRNEVEFHGLEARYFYCEYKESQTQLL